MWWATSKKRETKELPSSTRRDLSGMVKKDGDFGFSLGTSADFWKGIFTHENGMVESVRLTIFSPFTLFRFLLSGCRQSRTFDSSREEGAIRTLETCNEATSFSSRFGFLNSAIEIHARGVDFDQPQPPTHNTLLWHKFRL